MAKLTVKEASETYQGAMRNVLPAGSGVCATCHTFTDPVAGWVNCYPCAQNWVGCLDVVVPITYSVERGQMHVALRGYKDGYYAQERSYAAARIAAILWRFLEIHEPCVATAADVASFDRVTVVPSTTVERDERGEFRRVVSWCGPVKERLARILVPTGDQGEKHQPHVTRFRTDEDLSGQSVLLLDDTWTTGANAVSAACVLKQAGAAAVALVVVGRHVSPTWAAGAKTNEERMKALPPFDWTACCVHASA